MWEDSTKEELIEDCREMYQVLLAARLLCHAFGKPWVSPEQVIRSLNEIKSETG